MDLNKSEIVEFIQLDNTLTKKLRVRKEKPIINVVTKLEKWWNIKIKCLMYNSHIIESKDTVISLKIHKNDKVYVNVVDV